MIDERFYDKVVDAHRELVAVDDKYNALCYTLADKEFRSLPGSFVYIFTQISLMLREEARVQDDAELARAPLDDIVQALCMMIGFDRRKPETLRVN
jgi:hypothetical protein